MTVISGQHETIDALCYRVYGHTNGTVEAVLNANPGLAAKGPVLPQGTTVVMPEVHTPVTQFTQLWT